MTATASTGAARSVPVWAVAISLGFISIVTAAFLRSHVIPPPDHYFLYDQRAYHAMAEAPFSDAPLVHHGLYGRRVLVPFIAGRLGRFVGGVHNGFFVLTVGAFALLPAAALWWCGALGASRPARFAAGALMAVAPTVVGMLAWDVERIDAPVLLLIFAAAVFTVRPRPWLMLSTIVLVSAAKETALLSVLFALVWSVLVDRRLRPYAVAGAAVFVAIRVVLLPWLIPAAPGQAFDNLAGVRAILSSLSVRYAARRILLSTAAAWNLLLIPIAAVAADRSERRDAAMLLGLAIATAQTLGVSDNERVVAAGYPFALALCAFALDRIVVSRARAFAIAGLLVAQVPWLIVYGRMADLPWLRGVEIVIFCIATGVVIGGIARHARREPVG